MRCVSISFLVQLAFRAPSFPGNVWRWHGDIAVGGRPMDHLRLQEGKAKDAQGSAGARGATVRCGGGGGGSGGSAGGAGGEGDVDTFVYA